MTSPEAALRISGVVKRFGTNTVLDGIELEVAPGEVCGLIGANGSGKTTLLRAILGLVSIDAGRIEVDAAPVGSIVEHPSFYPYLSARVNLELLAALDRGTGAEMIDEALQRVGLAPRASDRVGGFSAGMRQRLGIAAALIRRPRLLLLDEPTSTLDPDGVQDTVRLVRQLADEDGVAAVIASHQLDMLDALVDRTSRLQDGRIR